MHQIGIEVLYPDQAFVCINGLWLNRYHITTMKPRVVCYAGGHNYRIRIHGADEYVCHDIPNISYKSEEEVLSAIDFIFNTLNNFGRDFTGPEAP